MDPVLRGVVEACTDEEADERIERLLAERLAPLVRKIVGRKLAAYRPDNRIPAEDLEDVEADTLVVLLQRLRAIRGTAAPLTIDSLDDYAATVTYSVCAHYLRRKHPQRARLKNRVRYALERAGRFAVWDAGGTGLHCGLSAWEGQLPDAPALETLSALERNPDRWPRSWKRPPFIEGADPAALLEEIFGLVGGPIDLDRAVGLVAAVWQIDRAREAAPAMVERLAAAGASPELAIDRRRLVERLWVEIGQLPLRQRLALLLNFRDGRGAGLLWLFPVSGVASIRAIAAALEMPAEALAALWGRLPLDDNAIAERLGCTRQQVINLRVSARKRLGNRLGPAEAASEGRAAAGANPRTFQTSMRSET
jgi:RNA polymerase sigma factor (sigma-70 family)